jgi:hypothetical protein
MYEQYKNDVQFVVVYIREAHAIDSRSPMQTKEMIEDPITLIERASVAKVCLTKMELRPIPAVVDRLDDKTNQAYKGWPDRLFLVGKNGKMAYSGGRGPFGFSTEDLTKAIDAELAKSKPAKVQKTGK